MLVARPDGKRRCAARRCSELFVPYFRSAKDPKAHNYHRYCSQRCADREKRYRLGTRTAQAFGMCANGLHERSPENTYWGMKDSRLMRVCRPCNLAAQKVRRDANPALQKKRHRDYYLAHREEILAKRRQQYFKSKLEAIRAA